MSEYRRFFSYIYACEQNMKTSNTGFAKIEMKGPMTTIELHLRNVFLPAPSACLYLFVRNGEFIQGFPLGDVPFSNGNADWRFTLNQPQLGESDYKITDAAGILLLLEDEIRFVSQWDEVPIDWSAFQVYEKPQETTEMPAEEKAADNEPQNPDTTRLSAAQAAPAEEHTIRSAELPLPQRQMFAILPEPAPAPDHVPDDIPDAPAQPDSSRIKTWRDTWQELLETQEVTQPFPNENIRCIRIELKDLRVLPSSNWHLCSNSFVLHAFFTYRHLILGEISSAKHSQWFVGVPGIQYRQEHVLAAIFGFSDFLPDRESANADAPFGYWYRIMSEEG